MKEMAKPENAAKTAAILLLGTVAFVLMLVEPSEDLSGGAWLGVLICSKLMAAVLGVAVYMIAQKMTGEAEQ